MKKDLDSTNVEDKDLVVDKDLIGDKDLDGWVNTEAQEEELAYMMELDAHHDIHKINLVD